MNHTSCQLPLLLVVIKKQSNSFQLWHSLPIRSFYEELSAKPLRQIPAVWLLKTNRTRTLSQSLQIFGYFLLLFRPHFYHSVKGDHQQRKKKKKKKRIKKNNNTKGISPFVKKKKKKERERAHHSTERLFCLSQVFYFRFLLLGLLRLTVLTIQNIN